MLRRFEERPEGRLEGAGRDPDDAPLLHYAERIDTLAWLPARLNSTPPADT